MQTWLQEANGNVELAASAAAAYGADVNDLALSDDGTCFFWRESRVQLMRSSLSSLPLQLPLPAFAIAVQRKAAVFCGWSKAGMKFVLSQPPRAFPAESNLSRDFVARHAFSHQLFHDYAAFCSGIMPPSHGIVLCDSNDSSEYAACFIAAGGSVDHTLPHRLSRHGLVDFASSNDTACCLKMRHACGNQPSKFGALMSDRIDRVFMHPLLAALCANVTMESFVRYPTHISSDGVLCRALQCGGQRSSPRMGLLITSRR